MLDASHMKAPARVRCAVSRRAEIVTPFQYYSEEGESIYVLEYSSHLSIAKIYLHFDPTGNLLARLLIADNPEQEGTFSSIENFSFSELQQLNCVETDFHECLAEMHLFSSQKISPPFDADELEQLNKLGDDPPIIIGGCGRSGTTLLLSVLGSHPDILAFPEELYAFYPKPFRLRKLLDAIQDYGTQRDWQRWCEKTPKNVRVFGDVLTIFEHEVRLIHIVRDGRDVVTSHHPNDTNRYYISPERWVADIKAGLMYADQTYLVRYEDFVREPQATLKGICDYLDEEFDERMLTYEKNTTVQENKAWEGRQIKPIQSESIGRWRLSENLERVDEFMNYPGAAELLHRLHYE